VAVLYGQAAYDQLATFGVAGELRHWLYAGNLRSAYYARHAAFFGARREALGVGGPRGRRERCSTRRPGRTRSEARRSSTRSPRSSTACPRDGGLVVKLHPHLERRADAIEALAARCRGRDVRLVRAQALCYPFLDVADAYVGDMSSLAYDYLAFNRPMFFTNPTAGARTDAAGSRLFACGNGDRAGPLRRPLPDRRRGVGARRGALRQGARGARRLRARQRRDAGALAVEMDALLAGPAPAWMDAA
jgi:hypothetical protein